MIHVDRMKKLDRRGVEENLTDHIYAGLGSEEQAATETEKSQESKTDRSLGLGLCT